MKKFERIAGIVAMVAIISAWIIGGMAPEKDLTASLQQALPQASEFKPSAGGIYAGYANQLAEAAPIGYVAIGRCDGYGGPMRTAVGLDMSGKLTGAAIVEHKETVPFFNRIRAEEYIKRLVGKRYTNSFTPGVDIDTVSGATVSLNAMATSMRRGVDLAADKGLKLDVYRSEIGIIPFGFPEFVLVLLFATGFLTYSSPLTARPKARAVLHWATRLAGLVLIGFMLATPLSIININSLLIGYGPYSGMGIYWAVLAVGVFLPLILTNKGVYCECICPFGAAQDVLKIAGGAKYTPPKRLQLILRWIQRSVALAAIIGALLFRNPAKLDYEVFGTFFTLTGTIFQFALLSAILIASLFLLRPWCNFLCPVRAISDYIRMLRSWGKKTHKKQSQTGHCENGPVNCQKQ